MNKITDKEIKKVNLLKIIKVNLTISLFLTTIIVIHVFAELNDTTKINPYEMGYNESKKINKTGKHFVLASELIPPPEDSICNPSYYGIEIKWTGCLLFSGDSIQDKEQYFKIDYSKGYNKATVEWLKNNNSKNWKSLPECVKDMIKTLGFIDNE